MPKFPKKRLPMPSQEEPVPAPEPPIVQPKLPSAPSVGPEWAGPFYPVVATSQFVDDKDNPASFSNVERTIRKQPIEWGALFDAKGKAKVVLTANSYNSVPIPAEMVELMRRMNGQVIFTHNHPRNSSFSADDVNLFIGCGMREIRVVSQRYVYSLSDPTFAFHIRVLGKNFTHLPGWDLSGINKQMNDELKSQEFARVCIEENIDGKARMMAMVLGTAVEDEKHILVADMVNRRLFTKWGLNYNVVHVEEA